MITKQDVKDYLGIDFEDEMVDRRIAHSIRVSDSFLEGALGVDYPKSDPRAMELSLMIIADIFDHHALTQKERATYRKLAHDMELQIRLDMRD